MYIRASPANAEDLMVYLSIAALVFATLFAGAALYITLVEHPARLTLTDGPLLTQWQVSYKRALPIQSGLAIAGGVAGFAAGYLSADWRWFVGSIVLLANWPFTLIVIFPVNNRLLGMQIGQASDKSRAMLKQWGKLHEVRSLLGTTTVLMFIWALVSAG